MSAPTRTEGPRFAVRTWREAAPGCAAPTMWFARIVPVRPEAAPFTDEQDERQAVSTCPDTPRLTMGGAVEAAIEKWERIWGDAGRCEARNSTGVRCELASGHRDMHTAAGVEWLARPLDPPKAR